MFKDLVRSRELAWQLFLRDFKARYAQSLIGWLWIFLLPAVAVGTFLLLGKSGAIRIEEAKVPYPIYGFAGISLWQIFAGGLLQTTATLVSTGSFVSKINFPRESLLIASLGQTIVEFLVRIILLLFLFTIYGLPPSLWMLLLPVWILPLLFLTLGLGFFTSLLNAIFRDTQTFISVILGFFLFFMPIMYTVSDTSLIYQLNKFNPIFFLITVPRDIIISGNFASLSEFLISSAIASIIFFLGWLVFNKAQSKIAEVV